MLEEKAGGERGGWGAYPKKHRPHYETQYYAVGSR